MTLDHDDTMIVIARLIVVEQLVATMIRERAIETGKSADDVARYAEEIKTNFESSDRTPRMQDFLTGAVDRLFQQIAADVRARENPET
jgi:uncharacterized lipoprotein YddW (UPF0748 family)